MLGDRFLDNLGALLDRSPPTSGRPGPGSDQGGVSRRRPDISGSLSRPAFENQIEWALGGAQQLVPGRLIFLRASPIADRFGEKWEAAAEHAEAIAAQTIERHLSLPDDAYHHFDKLTYLLLFTKMPPAAASAAAARIAVELAEQLVGASWTADMLTLVTVFGRLPDALEARAIPFGEPRKSSLLDRIVTSAEAGERAAPSRAVDDPLRDPAVVYRPMWDVRLGVLSTYLAVPARRSAAGDVHAGRHELVEPGDVDGGARLDRAVVARVAADLDAAVAAGRKFLVGVPVHFDTLAARAARAEYRAACEAIPAAARKLVIFELVDVPTGVPTGRLQEFCSILRNRARSVIACLPLMTTDFSAFAEAGVLSVGTDVADEHGPERTLIVQLHRFAAAAEKAKLDPFVHGLRTTSLTSSVVGAGFRYVDGNSVRSLVDAPQELRRYRPADLYLALYQGRQ
jgi:hypothetical protein